MKIDIIYTLIREAFFLVFAILMLVLQGNVRTLIAGILTGFLGMRLILNLVKARKEWNKIPGQ